MTRKVQVKQNFIPTSHKQLYLEKVFLLIFPNWDKLTAGFGISCQVKFLLQHCFQSGWVEKHQDGKN